MLVDTEELYFRANREALAGIGIDLDQAAYVQHFLRDGTGAWHLAEARGMTAGDIEALRAARDRCYYELVGAADVVIPGAADIVPALAARYRLAIVTSSEPEPFARTHARTGLLPHFELVLMKGDYERSKPEPDPYLRAVERLRAAPERCLVIEDSERGLRAAKAAGLACWVIPSALTAGGRFEAADAVLESLTAASRLLLDPLSPPGGERGG